MEPSKRHVERKHLIRGNLVTFWHVTERKKKAAKYSYVCLQNLLVVLRKSSKQFIIDIAKSEWHIFAGKWQLLYHVMAWQREFKEKTLSLSSTAAVAGCTKSHNNSATKTEIRTHNVELSHRYTRYMCWLSLGYSQNFYRLHRSVLHFFFATHNARWYHFI